MEVTSNKEELIFRNEYNGKVSYKIGISKKNQDGSYENGYIPVKFRKDVEVENKTKITIKNAWLDFYNKDKKTYPYIFINVFEVAENKEKNPYEEFGQSISAKTKIEEQLQITDEDCPW